MNPDMPPNARENLEASLTAFILGELPADQAFALGRAIEQDAELAKLYERLKQTIQLVGEAAANTPEQLPQPLPLKLSESRRQQLLQRFKTVQPREFAKPPRRKLTVVALAAVLAVIAFLASMAILTTSSQKSSLTVGVDVADLPSAKATLQVDVLDSPGRAIRDSSSPATDPQTILPPNPTPSSTKPKSTTIILPTSGQSVTLASTSGGGAGGGGAGPSVNNDPEWIGLLERPASRPLGINTTRESGQSASATNRDFDDGATARLAGSDKSGFGWVDQQHQKNANIGFLGESAETMSRTRLQESAKNSSDSVHTGSPGDVSGKDRIKFPEATATTDATTELGRFYTAITKDKNGVAGTDLNLSDSVKLGVETKLPSFRPSEPAPAAASSAASVMNAADEARKTPILGEVPVVGDLLRSKREASASAGVAAASPTPAGSLSVIQTNLLAWDSVLSGDSGSAAPAKSEFFYNIGKGTVAMNGATLSPDGKSTTEDRFAKAITMPQDKELVLQRNFQDGSNNANYSFRTRSLDQGGAATNESPSNVYNLNVVGYINLPVQTTDSLTIAANNADTYNRNSFYRLESQLDSKSVRRAGSSIVLPPTTADQPVAGQSATSFAADTRPPIEAPSQGVAVSEGLRRQLDRSIPQQELDLKIAKGRGDLPAAAELLDELRDVAQADRTKAPEAKLREAEKTVESLGKNANISEALKAGRPVSEEQKSNAGKVEQNRPYSEAQRKLEELESAGRILQRKIAAENIDVSLPKTDRVEIMEQAQADSKKSPTLLERIRGTTERSARVSIERDRIQISGQIDTSQMSAYDPYFVQNEFEAIQSEAVLGKVVKELNLNESWAKKYGAGNKLSTAQVVQLLKKNLDLRAVPNSSSIEIGVKSDKPEEAAKLANAVAEAYKSHRLEQRAALSRVEIGSLEERWKDQEKKVAQAKADLERLEKESIAQQADVAPPKVAVLAAVPQPEVQTRENPYSTFSLNVSDVSFKLATASLEKGVMPDPATVRSEEFINAFDYRDPEPPAGVPVAFAWERAGYPFAQNRDLLRFSIKTAAQGRQSGRPLNLVLLLDNSGSMERADRAQIILEALRVLASQLQPQDKLSVVTFARTARLWVDGAPGDQAGKVAEEAAKLTPQGGTNLEEAINLAYQTALRHYAANGINRVVLLTDGAANLGNVEPEALKQKVEAQRKQGIALDCFGIGWEGYNDDLLEVLSRNGDGRYGFINTPEEATTEFAGQLAGALRVAASDVKVQVEFNTNRVAAYRQIGYAKHQLTKEQFRDNTVDAAEIGAAESGNALYVIETNPRGEGPLAIVRVRYKVPGTEEYHEHEWTVPYTGNALPLEQSTPAMRLAGTASAFSEWLVASPYAGEVTPDRLLGYLRTVPEVYGADARPKKLEWMIRQAKSLNGK
jgi:Mg-chelatase subunit ChlD